MEEVLIPLIVFAAIPATIWIVMHHRVKAKARTADLVKTMVEKGQEVTPEIIKTIGYTPSRTHKDLRTGLILLATGLAFLLLGQAIPEEEAPQVMGGIAMFPILIGLAFLVFWYAVSRKDQD